MIKKELLLATLLVSSYSYCPPTEMALWIMSTPSTAHIQVQQQQTSSNISGGLISAITASFSWAKEWLAAKATTANEKQWNYENRLSSTAQAAFAADKYTVEGLLQKQLGEFTAKLESCKTPQDFTNVLSDNTSDSFKHGQLRKIKLVHKPGAI